ncbi:MAG TPA: hypothetical protein VM802_03885 [Chitinophaga sp.]|uniref:hypothetical protein n=1 Tax=Chitinophaga sp. TaxID=1869181 RepID=UPI002BEB6B86|nr:hypothetical protein [Chitinophaga sp.]HVI43976.1 hypothetical protein [Chitinophaga sp.]
MSDVNTTDTTGNVDPVMEEEEDRVPLIQRLRSSVLPIKPDDGAAVRWMKNTGFAGFCVLFGLVSLAVVAAVTMAL